MRIKKLRLLVFIALVSLPCLPALAQRGEGSLDPAPPKNITVDQIIQKFADKETAFKEARENYTYRQSVKVQTVDGDTVDGEYQQVWDVLFDDRGRRVENVVFAPQSTLSRISMSREDFEDIRNVLPFVLTSTEIPLYNITYVGHQRQDELTTYVFDIAPKQIDPKKRYFDGRIWVDDQDFQIVKTSGRTVPEFRSKKGKAGEENLFPRFTTWRQQIDGKYWFPTYTRADDVLHFSTGDVHIREIIKYENYKRFGSKVRITYEGQELPPASQQPGQNGGQSGGQQPPK